MAQADGTIVIDTRIDDDGIQKGTKDIKNGLDDVAKGADTAGSKLKNGLGKLAKTGAKIGLAAITAVSAGIVALTKQSVESFAEYEQLAGGVKKIFDEMDNSKIFADAANAYKDLGMSANEYLAVMNNLGATFSATMGDEAGYETAKRGLQAISDFASGTGASVDELSEKYKLITKSTSQYQSIADQFSGILPATSADFLKAAQAAGLLSDEYTQLTQVPVAEYQQAVTAMLEKGVDALGLTGNTAAEAEETLSGSLAMMGAAWKNLVTGMADENANLEQLMSNLVSSVVAVTHNLVPRLRSVLVSVGRLVQELAPVIIAELPGLAGELLPQLLSAASSLVMALVTALPEILVSLQSVIPMAIESVLSALPLLTGAALQIVVALVNGLSANAPLLISSALSAVQQIVLTLLENLPLLIEAGLQLLMALSQGIVEAIPQLTDMLPEIIETTVSTLLSLLPLILEAGVEILVGLIEGIVDAIPQLVEMLPEIIDTICTVLLDNIDLIISAGFQLLVGLISGIWDCIPELVAMLPEVISAIVETLLSYLLDIWEIGVQLLESFIEGIASMIGDLTSKAKEVGEDLIEVFTELPGKIISVGKDLVSGLWQGISDSYTWIKDKISGWVGDVLGFIKNLFGIHSPSKKTAYFGKMLSYGLGEGILSGASAALRAVDNLGSQISGRFDGISLGTPALAGFHVPHLASGAVIPPRSEFMAVLGDQKHGTNIETPEKLLRDIIREEMGSTSGKVFQFIAELDGHVLFNKTISEAEMTLIATGRNPFELA